MKFDEESFLTVWEQLVYKLKYFYSYEQNLIKH